MKTLLSLLLAFMVFCCPLHAEQSTQLTVHQIFSTMPHRSPLPWGVLVVALAADVVTTQQAMHRGCHEANSTYGPHPSMGLLIGTHAAFAGGTWFFRDSKTLYVFAALFTAAAIHNATIRC